MWYDVYDHLVVTCARRLKVVEKGVVRPLAPSSQAPPPSKPARAGKAYVLS